MKELSDFIDYVAPHFPDAPDDLLEFTIHDAIVEFMQESKLATDTVRLDLYPGTNEYILGLPDCRIPIAITKVMVGNPEKHNMLDFDRLRPTEEPAYYGYHATLDDVGEPVIWIGEPVEGCVADVTYAWSVARNNCQIPDLLYNRYINIIQKLAMYRLYIIPGQEWSNIQFGQLLRDEAYAMMKTLRNKRKAQGSNVIKSPPFIGRRCSMFRGF